MMPETAFIGTSLSYLFAFICTPQRGGSTQERQLLPFIADTLALCVNWISRLLLTFVKPKGGGQIKLSCSSDASSLSYNARSCRSKIMLTFVSLSDVIQFRKTLVLIFIVWLLGLIQHSNMSIARCFLCRSPCCFKVFIIMTAKSCSLKFHNPFSLG